MSPTTDFSKTALLLVDIQNDFLPGGSLPVPEGDKIFQTTIDLCHLPFELVIASQDYHPKGHVSFASTHGKKVGDEIDHQGSKQILWPDHCVQGTQGVKIAHALPLDKIDHIVRKGENPLIDSYSAFYDNQRLQSTGLEELLKEKGIKRIAVVGLSTDYCVSWTVLDGLSLGFQVDLILDGCGGMDAKKGDIDRALNKMEEAGARLFQDVTSFQCCKNLCMKSSRSSNACSSS